MEVEYVSGNQVISEVLAKHGVSPTSGSSTTKTAEWGKKRAEYRRKIIDERIAQAAVASQEALVTLDIDLFGLAPDLVPALRSHMAQKGGLSPQDVKVLAELILLRSAQPTSLTKTIEQQEMSDAEIDEVLDRFLAEHQPAV